MPIPDSPNVDTASLVQSRSIRRFSAGGSTDVEDALAVEEPLEIRAAGDPIAMTMRTPGHDDELAAGFLFAEGILTSLKDIGRIGHCGQPGSEGFGNTIDVTPAPGTAFDVDRVLTTRRGTLTTSACGVCGRQSIDDLLERCQSLARGPEVEARKIPEMMDQLRSKQHAFEQTGGLHGVAIFDAGGQMLSAREDVGRHNAVDKVVGNLLLSNRLGSGNVVAAVLAVSGRASFEIVQKAAAAGIPIIVAVSAASTLAADLARRLNITLVGFVRGSGFNVYADDGRLLPEQTL